MTCLLAWCLRALLGALLILALPLGAAEANTLRLLVRSEYLDPAILRDFEREFSCAVVVEQHDGDDALLAKLQGTPSFDVTVLPDHQVRPLIGRGLLAPLRKEKIPNLSRLEEAFRTPPFDPAGEYTVPYQWGSLGILVRPAKDAAAPPATWGLLLDPAQQFQPFVLMNSPRDLIGAALRWRGHPLNSLDLTRLREARELLAAAAGRALAFDSSEGAQGRVLARTAAAAMIYSSEAVRAMAEDPALLYLVPREGSRLWVDSFVILKAAPNRDLAEQFINFMLHPLQSARVAGFTRAATTNASARPFLTAAELANPNIYPPAEVRARLEYLQDPGEKSPLLDEVWKQVKAP